MQFQAGARIFWRAGLAVVGRSNGCGTIDAWLQKLWRSVVSAHADRIHQNASTLLDLQQVQYEICFEYDPEIQIASCIAPSGIDNLVVFVDELGVLHRNRQLGVHRITFGVADAGITAARTFVALAKEVAAGLDVRWQP